MFNLFRKHKHEHEFHAVAFDYGYRTSYSEDGGEKRGAPHHLTFSKCACGKRVMTESEHTKRSKHSVPHPGITNAAHTWEINDILLITPSANVYNDDYCITKTTPDIDTWKYKPVTSVRKILKLLQDDSEFKELTQNHPCIGTALDDFVVLIKLHENI
jgi:hypothetical protein